MLLWGVWNGVGVVSMAAGEAERALETGIVDTGTVNARAMSEFCATGDVAVCAVVSFSFFLHLALRFWNHTFGGEESGEIGKYDE